MRFGLGLGLAGAAGIRTYLPLIVMGLLTRFSDTMSFSEPFSVFASAPVILLLVVLALIERMAGASNVNYHLLVLGLRALGGAIIFAGTFSGFGIFGGLLFGGMVAVLVHLIMVRTIPDLRIPAAYSSAHYREGFEEILALTVTLFALLLPWSSYLLWALIIFVYIKKMKDYNHRYRPDSKARSWR